MNQSSCKSEEVRRVIKMGCVYCLNHSCGGKKEMRNGGLTGFK